MAFEQKIAKDEWIQVNPASLSDDLQAAYETLREARRVAAVARKTFEDMMQEAAPAGQRMVFGYNFGKLSIALVAGVAKAAAKPTKGAISLADFLKAKATLGDRA